MEPQSPVEEVPSGEPETATVPHPVQEAPPDARSLVHQMIAAGEWPEPRLVEQILASGEAVVEPLQEILRTRPQGWPAEAPLTHAAGILSMLRPLSALPDLIAAARFYQEETCEPLADAIAAYGPEGFEFLLQLIGDPSITGYHRADFTTAAKYAAGQDPIKRARLAEVLRSVFQQVAGQAKERQAADRRYRQYLDGDQLEVDIATSEQAPEPELQGELDPLGSMQAYYKVHPYEELAFLVCELADLADPLALDMIQSAFDDGLVDDEVVSTRTVSEIYSQGGEIYDPPPPWFEQYSARYREEEKDRSERERIASMPPMEFPSRTSYPSFAPPSDVAPPPRPQPVEPFRNVAPKIGRNDPCWCGSGKKYKKCHLGQDAPG